MTSEQKVRERFPNVRVVYEHYDIFDEYGYEIWVDDICLAWGKIDEQSAWDEAAKAMDKLKLNK